MKEPRLGALGMERPRVDAAAVGRPNHHGGRADRRPDEPRLGQWRIDDTLRPELIQESLCHLEGAAVDPDVLSKHEDALVPIHFFPQGLMDRFEIGDLHPLLTCSEWLSAAS